MFDSIKSFVFLSFIFISGVLLGVIYTPELVVQAKKMMNENSEKPVMNKKIKVKKIKVKQRKTIRLV